jgi:mRNA-degrading endonuclease HigB of HigAB toxin-antitoxin module
VAQIPAHPRSLRSCATRLRSVFPGRGEANDCRLVTLVRYQGGVLMIRFFGSHEEYGQIDAETVS